jgi:hypothetical protein
MAFLGMEKGFKTQNKDRRLKNDIARLVKLEEVYES